MSGGVRFTQVSPISDHAIYIYITSNRQNGQLRQKPPQNPKNKQAKNLGPESCSPDNKNSVDQQLASFLLEPCHYNSSLLPDTWIWGDLLTLTWSGSKNSHFNGQTLHVRTNYTCDILPVEKSDFLVKYCFLTILRHSRNMWFPRGSFKTHSKD